MSSSNNVASSMLWVSKCAWTCEILLQFFPCMERTTRMKHKPNPHQKALSFPFATSQKNQTQNLTWSSWPSLNVTWSIEGSLSPACVRERVKSLPHASCLKSKRWPVKEEGSSCTRSETASKLLDMDQSYGGWPALQHPPNFRSCNIEMGSKKRSKTSPSSSQSWQTTKCVANKRLDLLLYEVAWLHDVSRAQAHACKSGAKVARFRAPDSTLVSGTLREVPSPFWHHCSLRCALRRSHLKLRRWRLPVEHTQAVTYCFFCKSWSLVLY